jgi:N-acetylneuraminate lyase
MGLLGVDCGPVRLPLRALTPEQIAELRRRLDAAGFFDWILR